MIGKFWTLGALSALAAVAPASLGATRYVNASLATGANNGSSWVNAYRGPDALARALTAASSAGSDQIWVARGTYVPSLAADRTVSFVMKSSVDIIGGFVGTETSADQRDPVANPTVLSGDLLGDDTGASGLDDNSYHVLTANGVTNVDLFGLVIRGGNANGAQNQNQDRGGGALILSGAIVVFNDCVIELNRCTFGGGAGYINGSQAIFRGCEFNDNIGGNFGGAFDTNAARTTFTRCAFRGNRAGRAGALEVFGNNGVSGIANCLFIDNIATGNNGGGGLWVGNGGNASLTNVTVFRNQSIQAAGGGVMVATGGTLSAVNSIFSGNSGTAVAPLPNQLTAGGQATATFSSFPSAFAGVGNITSDPRLLSDGRLRWGSPGIDAGQSNYASDFPIDLDGNPRLIDDPATADTGLIWNTFPMIDMGAFEYQRSSCVADLVGSDVLAPDGAVTIDDLIAMLIFFEGGSLRGDIDDGSRLGAPDRAVTIDDLVYYLQRFEDGC